jgi:ribosomal protein S27AE
VSAVKASDLRQNEELKIVALADIGIQGYDLADTDIVITTYDVLARDLRFQTHNENERARRHAAKYPYLPTPLTKLTWWRVVLDEVRFCSALCLKTPLNFVLSKHGDRQACGHGHGCRLKWLVERLRLPRWQIVSVSSTDGV